jgi:hypothetical protein
MNRDLLLQQQEVLPNRTSGRRPLDHLKPAISITYMFTCTQDALHPKQIKSITYRQWPLKTQDLAGFDLDLNWT